MALSPFDKSSGTLETMPSRTLAGKYDLQESYRFWPLQLRTLSCQRAFELCPFSIFLSYSLEYLRYPSRELQTILSLSLYLFSPLFIISYYTSAWTGHIWMEVHLTVYCISFVKFKFVSLILIWLKLTPSSLLTYNKETKLNGFLYD